MYKFRSLAAGTVLFAAALAGGVLPGAIAQDAAPDEVQMSDEEFERVFSLGQINFSSNCASCHGDNGEGNIGPSLVDNEYLGDTKIVTETIIRGFSYMPPFGDQLSDEQVAAIGTYIRNAWGNAFGPVFPDEAAAARR